MLSAQESAIRNAVYPMSPEEAISYYHSAAGDDVRQSQIWRSIVRYFEASEFE